MTETHQSAIRDFSHEIATNANGVTIQILYGGKPSAGISCFGGTFKSARLEMAAMLRQLADEVYRLPEGECHYGN